MKIVVLLRYPKAENNAWKSDIITRLSDFGHEVTVVFGECSYYRHLKSALKIYGFDMFSKKKNLDSGYSKNVYLSIKDLVPVLKVSSHNSKSCLNLLKKINPDLILMLGTGIVSEAVLSVPIIGTIHCHKGSLPKYKGLDSVKWTLLFGDELEITTHFVEREIDSGQILLSRKIDYSNCSSVSQIRKKCQDKSVSLLLDTVKYIEKGRLRDVPKLSSEGKQYYQMHPFIGQLVETKRRIKMQ